MPSIIIDRFFRMLARSPPGPVFNPWRDIDADNDIGDAAPRIRRAQLRAYLSMRIEPARLVLVGEALSYRGGHFTGIAMTSERMLLGADRVVHPSEILGDLAPRRTSRPERNARGFAEPTATIVWGTLADLEIPPSRFVLWNAFPWHTYDARAGWLSNRTPTRAEFAAGKPVLDAFLAMFSCERVVAVGRLAAAQLADARATVECVRHPASAGAPLFRRQMSAIARAL